MANRSPQTSPFKLIWRAPFKFKWQGSVEELHSLLDDDEIKHLARIGIIESSGTRHCIVELTPQNGADREKIETHLNKMIPRKVKGRKSFHARNKPRKAMAIKALKNREVPYIPIEEHGKMNREQINVERTSEINRLNILPDSDEHLCSRKNYGVVCGSLLVEELVYNEDEFDSPIEMFRCCICGDLVDKVVLMNRRKRVVIV